MTTVDEPAPTPDTDQEDALDPTSVPSELVANSVGEYLRASFARMLGGETGILPVVAGLLLADVPCGLERLLVAGGISCATAKLVLAGLGAPHEAPRAPRPTAERCRAELRCRPGLAAVARDIDADDLGPT